MEFTELCGRPSSVCQARRVYSAGSAVVSAGARQHNMANAEYISRRPPTAQSDRIGEADQLKDSDEPKVCKAA